MPAVLCHAWNRSMDGMHGVVWCHITAFAVDSVSQEVKAGSVRPIEVEHTAIGQ